MRAGKFRREARPHGRLDRTPPRRCRPQCAVGRSNPQEQASGASPSAGTGNLTWLAARRRRCNARVPRGAEGLRLQPRSAREHPPHALLRSTWAVGNVGVCLRASCGMGSSLLRVTSSWHPSPRPSFASLMVLVALTLGGAEGAASCYSRAFGRRSVQCISRPASRPQDLWRISCYSVSCGTQRHRGDSNPCGQSPMDF